MAYSTHNFSSGDTLYASQLNEMDNQIALNEQMAKSAVKTVNGTAPDANGNVVVSGGGGSSSPYTDQYRLLKKVETGSATNVGIITLDKDDAGNSFSVRHIRVYVVVTGTAPNCAGRLLINDIGSEAAFFNVFMSDQAGRYYIALDVDADGLLVFAEHSGGANANSWAALKPSYSIHLPSDLGVEVIPAITKLRIYLNDSKTLPANTTVYIYGY